MRSFFLSFIFLALASPALALEPENHADGQKDFVSDIFPYGIDFVHDHIALEFDSDARAYYEDYNAAIYALPGNAAGIDALTQKQRDRFIAFPLVRPHKFYVFYGVYRTMQGVLATLTPYAALGHSNAALQRYAALPMETRANDLYLWSPDAPFWLSEYTLGDKKLPFRSYFIVHLSPVDKGHTNVEIIENEPVVSLGRHPNVDAHGVVHPYDIREVEPTTSDREFLLSCMRQFIDRGLPGRHWFSCRDADSPPEAPPIPFTTQ